MARLPRLVIPHQPHHIIQRSNDHQPVFRDAGDYSIFLKWLLEAAKLCKVAIHAYVLMPDHFHLLASPEDEAGLARMMQWVGRQYVPYFNRRYQRAGTLWQGRYKATVIDAEYLMACSRYIELNPVRAGIETVADYPWSSYAHHAGMVSDPLVTNHAFYWALGNTPFEREIAYRKSVEEVIAVDGMADEIDEMTALTEATLKGWAFGSEAFKTALAKHAKRPVAPGKRGRPPKLKVKHY